MLILVWNSFIAAGFEVVNNDNNGYVDADKIALVNKGPLVFFSG